MARRTCPVPSTNPFGETVVVKGVRCTGPSPWDLSGDDAVGIALDQRAFGPRRLLVAVADREGRVEQLLHCRRTDPPEAGLWCCLAHAGGGVAAIAYSDEPVTDGPPPPDLAGRLARAREAATAAGIHLIDWMLCDDHLFRSMKAALEPGAEWWDVPPVGD